MDEMLEQKKKCVCFAQLGFSKVFSSWTYKITPVTSIPVERICVWWMEEGKTVVVMLRTYYDYDWLTDQVK